MNSFGCRNYVRITKGMIGTRQEEKCDNGSAGIGTRLPSIAHKVVSKDSEFGKEKTIVLNYASNGCNAKISSSLATLWRGPRAHSQ